jgi:SIR2-like domain
MPFASSTVSTEGGGMIDPMTTLAFSVYSSKGVYALLLGSGVSRSSGILTGWDIVQDLIRKVAAVEEEDCGENPAGWYETTYGKEPEYSDLLKTLAKTSAERGWLLRSYFEPSEKEREEGKKVPTAAHMSIARLVLGGYIRVIVTTNFDRLLEQAFEAEGVVPTVISSSDAVQGAAALVHAGCSVIKVHGDYLDTRLKNTREELAEYQAPMNRLLDQIFDEYGLIVCGWSADWDTALRAAIERCPNRRFTTFWSAYGEVKGAALGICQRQQAEVIAGKDADTFFGQLAEKVASVAEISAQHPVATPVAVATLKRYLVEDRYRIQLADFVLDEVRSAVSAISPHPGHLYKPGYDDATVGFVMGCDVQFDRLLRLLITGSFWGTRSQGKLWPQAVEHVARSVIPGSERPSKSGVAVYPALVAVHRGSYVCFAVSCARGDRHQ